MSDTIDWLETIGKNAALRYASAGDLAYTLEQGGASDALKAAIAGGDSSLLFAEFAHKPMTVQHNPHAPWHEEEPDHDDDHGDDAPEQPPKPDQGQPSRDS